MITEHDKCGRANLVEADLWSQLPVGGSGLLELLPQAVAFVAHDLAISPAWLSDNMGPVSGIHWEGTNDKLWLSHGKLEVSVPDPSYILTLKLPSGREVEFLSVQGGGLQSEMALYHDRDNLITM